MSKVIGGLYYSESHEFVRVEGDFGFVGITDYAQNALGNVPDLACQRKGR